MAPVYHGQWSFHVDTFYVTSSCGHVHPRATYSELDTIFSAPLGDRRNRADHQDHWYEAQLLHFGLPPTKGKATAKMRLMDAFQDGILEVPAEILQMEATLARNWIQQDLEARLLGPSMRTPIDPAIAEATATDTTGFGTTQRPSVDEEGKAFGAGATGGAGVQGKMRSQRNKMQPPHTYQKRRKHSNGESSARPMKSARYRDQTGGPGLQVQIHANSNNENLYQTSTVIPKLVGNRRGHPALHRELQQIGYQTVPLLHQTISGTVSMFFPVPETKYHHL
ncbi:hypothetical protein PDIG_44340 [Penicillium digitatum PHI26]|uniref:Uncharacterized protein n=2 Tax=Penicillium digitatum TaxID=36651 RepID=K9FS60_PEND2|nr:hypothetical protein PDIP_35580 [Penicillium digitatum Pd1]EKV12510.1 hypothetical protein PDIG_44340 [Penicillium digitatum PHI26]EKV16447.1 hypothetical protein PDIP_35580 [Penicillium digitatum Pd1]